jgi:hypothetical protein
MSMVDAPLKRPINKNPIFRWVIIGVALLLGIYGGVSYYSKHASVSDSKSEQYLASFHEAIKVLNISSSWSDAELVTIGNDTCATLNSGGIMPELFAKMLEKENFSAPHDSQQDVVAYGSAMGAATQYLCPKYLSAFVLFASQVEKAVSYIHDGRNSINDGSSWLDEELLAMGNSVCVALNSGTTVSEAFLNIEHGLIQAARTSQQEGAAVGVAISAGVKFLCPEYTDALNSFMSQ